MNNENGVKSTQNATTSVAESLYTNKNSLEAIFRILDKDNSGQISLEEFGDACDLLQKHLPGTDTKEQLLEVCKMMDINKDGLVDLNEFLEAFRLCEAARRGVSLKNSPSPEPTLKQNGSLNVREKNTKSSPITEKTSLLAPTEESDEDDPEDSVSTDVPSGKQGKKKSKK